MTVSCTNTVCMEFVDSRKYPLLPVLASIKYIMGKNEIWNKKMVGWKKNIFLNTFSILWQLENPLPSLREKTTFSKLASTNILELCFIYVWENCGSATGSEMAQLSRVTQKVRYCLLFFTNFYWNLPTNLNRLFWKPVVTTCGQRSALQLTK